MIYFRRISGQSMSPTLSNGDYIVAIKPLFNKYSEGDIVIVSHPIYGEIIKRILSLEEQILWLVGDGNDTLSSEKMGAIDRKWLLAKMVWHIHP